MFYHGISLSEIIVIVIDIVSSKPNKYCRAAQFAACAVQRCWTPTRQPSNPKPNPWGKNSQEKKDLYINFQIFSFALETVV